MIQGRQWETIYNLYLFDEIDQALDAQHRKAVAGEAKTRTLLLGLPYDTR